MTRIPVFTAGVSIAKDWFVFFGMFTVVSGNLFVYLMWILHQLVDSNSSFPAVLLFKWTPICLALSADALLLATVFGDPGIVKRRDGGGKSPAEENGGIPAAVQIGGMTMQTPMNLVGTARLRTDSNSHGPLMGGMSGASQQNQVFKPHELNNGTPTTPGGSPSSPEPTMAEGTACVPVATANGQPLTTPRPRFNETIDVHFCPVCKVHVEMFDHHCAIIGACIGRFTMGTFIGFLMFAWMLCLYGLPPGIYVLFHKLEHFDLARGGILFLDLEVLAPMVNICSGLVGGGYTFWLWAHYTLTAYQGKNSLHRRRKYIADHWDELNAMERNGAMPIGSYFRKGGSFRHLWAVLKDIRFWQRAPIFPYREL